MQSPFHSVTLFVLTTESHIYQIDLNSLTFDLISTTPTEKQLACLDEQLQSSQKHAQIEIDQ